jgi:addiction module HigA family antidote
MENEMSIQNNKKINRRPTHPGEMLREEYMPDFGLNVTQLAKALGVSRQSVNELVHEKRALSLDMALRISKLFDDSPESWLTLQQTFDLWEAKQVKKATFPEIHPITDTQIAY